MRVFSAGLISLLWAGFLFGQRTDLEPIYSQVTAAYRQGRLEDAETQLRALLAGHPSEVRALSLLGVVLDGQKRYPDAEPYYLKAIELAPGSAALQNNLGNHYAVQHDLEKAQQAFLRAVALEPRHSNANLQLAQINLEKKNFAGALRRLALLPAADQNSPGYRVLQIRALLGAGMKEQAAEAVRQLEAVANGDPGAAFALGMAYVETGRFPDAEKAFAQVLKSDPTNFDVLYNLGTAALRSGNLDRARAIFQQALQQRPEDPDSLVGLARALVGSRHEMEALPLLVRANKSAPARADVLLLTAQAASGAGLYGDSAVAYDRYLKLEPGDDLARRERGYALARSSRYKEALTDLEWYARKHPKDPWGHFQWAVALSFEEKEKALEEINRALQLDPQFEEARFARGVLTQRLGRNQDAIRDLEACSGQDPTNVKIQEELARALLAAGQAERSAAILKNAIAAAPGTRTLYFQYSRALRVLGRTEEMTQAIAKFEQLGGGRETGSPRPGVLDFLSLQPADQEARYVENLKNAVLQRPTDEELKLRLIEVLLAQGRAQETAPLLDQIQKSSRDPRVVARCARLLVDAELYREALSLIDRAIELGPPPPTIYLDRAMAYLQTAGAPKALEAMDAIAPGSRDGDYYLLRAQILDALGDFEKSVEALNQALHAAPSRPDLYLQACAFLMKHKKYAEGLELLKQSEQYVPGSPELRLARAILLEMSNRSAEAARLLADIQAQWPEWAAPYVIHGIVMQSQHQAAEAKQLFETAIALGSKDPSVYYHLCLAVKDLTPGDSAAAYKIIARGLELDPEDPYMAAEAGRVALDMKNFDAALAHLQLAIRLYPEMADAHWLLANLYRITGQDEKQQVELAEVKRLNALFPPGTQTPPSMQNLLFSVRRPKQTAAKPAGAR